MKTLWNTIVYYPFLNLLLLLYYVTGNSLGWATVLVAVLARIALLPSSKKQFESMQKMANLQPKLKKIQEKYKNDKEKLAEAQMKLYKESGYNPLGCFGSFLPQFIILIAIIQVIRVVTTSDITGIYPQVQAIVFPNGITPIQTTFFGIDLAQSYTSIAKTAGVLTKTTYPYIIIAGLVGIFQYVSIVFMQRIREGDKPKKEVVKKRTEPMTPEEMQEQMMKSTNYIFPLMTVFTAITVPSVLSLYWIVQSILMILQYWFIDKTAFIKVTKSFFAKKK